MIYLAEYRTHQSIAEMNASVSGHITDAKLGGNVRKVLECLAKHSLKFVGACHIKADTIAKELGISRSTVTRCIKKLKESHVINVFNNPKANGIKGANIYAIIFLSQGEPSNEPSKMSHRETHGNTIVSTVDTHNIESESLSFNLSFNPFVVSNVSTYNPSATPFDLKMQLREIYQPVSVENNQEFEELCKIAFGRLKQYMHSHSVPYLQLEQIVLKAMHDLVRKQNVKNQFAMYSSMIKRQVEQLFEQHIKPKKSVSTFGKKVGVVPDWFSNGEHLDKGQSNEMSAEEQRYFEGERQKLLAKLG